MIYVVLKEPAGHEPHEEVVFASTSKTVAEHKCQELTAIEHELYKLTNLIRQDVSAIIDTWPILTPPDVKSLPERKLVWHDCAWRNPYYLEYEEAWRKQSSDMRQLTQDTIAKYADIHNVSQQSLRDLYGSFQASYSIKEVESD